MVSSHSERVHRDFYLKHFRILHIPKQINQPMTLPSRNLLSCWYTSVCSGTRSSLKDNAEIRKPPACLTGKKSFPGKLMMRSVFLLHSLCFAL